MKLHVMVAMVALASAGIEMNTAPVRTRQPLPQSVTGAKLPKAQPAKTKVRNGQSPKVQAPKGQPQGVMAQGRPAESPRANPPTTPMTPPKQDHPALPKTSPQQSPQEMQDDFFQSGK